MEQQSGYNPWVNTSVITEYSVEGMMPGQSMGWIGGAPYRTQAEISNSYIYQLYAQDKTNGVDLGVWYTPPASYANQWIIFGYDTQPMEFVGDLIPINCTNSSDAQGWEVPVTNFTYFNETTPVSDWFRNGKQPGMARFYTNYPFIIV